MFAEYFEEAYNKTCSNGHEAYRRFNGQYHEHYLGDSCQDLLCPDNFQCNQVNDLFAKCCSIEESKLTESGIDFGLGFAYYVF